ncbi:hypothetical protein [Bacillus sp. EB600]|uniref:arsenate reductase/protein-tyrosine-phosphatase family protein n=1 Tax=Bacillus sp. EB600 TaxID=2806345 RepID=UPI0035C21562
MAEALFRHLVKKENLTNKIAVDSAATSSWQFGFPPHEGTLDILKKYNISSDRLVGRHLKKEDFWKFDYIIGMDVSNIENIYRITGKPNHPKIIRLHFYVHYDSYRYIFLLLALSHYQQRFYNHAI